MLIVIYKILYYTINIWVLIYKKKLYNNLYYRTNSCDGVSCNTNEYKGNYILFLL